MAKVAKKELPLKGACVIETFRSDDERGTFVKLADGALLAELGFETKDVFYSVNRKNSLRGLHYLLPYPQARAVFCMKGRIFDVIVDMRKSSPTFGKWHGVELSGDGGRGVYVPRGFAHGFLSLEEGSTVLYFADEKHSQESDLGVRYDDPQIGIKWPLGSAKPIVSKRDTAFPLLKDAKAYD